MLKKFESYIEINKKIVFVGLFLISFLITSFGINQTGETWDEIPYYNAAKQYASSLFHFRFGQENWNANKEHPPVAKYIYSAASVFEMRQDGENYTGGRIASAAMLSIAIALVFLFAAELFTFTTGLFASVFLMLTPPFIGFGRVLGMDSPTTLVFLLIAIAFYRFAKSEARARDYVWPVVIFALGIATRYNIVLSAIFLPVAIVLFAKWRTDYKKWVSLIVFPLGAVLIFYLIWPYLWSDPIGAMKLSVGHWGQVREWFLGVKDAILPSSYFLIYFIYSVPIAVMLFALIGLIFKPWNDKKLYILVLMLVPFINSFIGIKQGGVRYLLFAFIPIAIFAGIGFIDLLKILKSSIVQLLIVILLIVYMAIGLVSYYPYYIDYYNELMGGARGNHEKKLLQVGWWGEGAKRSADYLNQSAPENSTIFNAMMPDHTLDNLRPDLIRVAADENPDYIVINTMRAWSSDFDPGPEYFVVHEEKAAGAPIITIYRHKK